MKSYVAIVCHADRKYTISFPDLAGCEAVGDTIEETRVTAARALAAHLQGLVAAGEVIPTPSSLAEVVADPQWRSEQVDAIILAVRPVLRS